MAIAVDSFSHRSLLSKLRPTIELEVRSSMTTVGGSINDHLGAHAKRDWLVLELAGPSCSDIAQHDFLFPYRLTSPPSWAQHLGIPLNWSTSFLTRMHCGKQLQEMYSATRNQHACLHK